MTGFLPQIVIVTLAQTLEAHFICLDNRCLVAHNYSAHGTVHQPTIHENLTQHEILPLENSPLYGRNNSAYVGVGEGNCPHN